tara:strand:- start:690 stop:1175 length:486 start_codon:yes stop_codon:yes gene_type:complete
MTVTKSFSVSYVPPTYNVKTVIYAVNPKALYAVVENIQIANVLSSAHTADVYWVDYSLKTQDSLKYNGDGSIYETYYTYEGAASHPIIIEGSIPKGSSLSVLSSPMHLNPKDMIILKPSSIGSDAAFSPTITVVEHFQDSTYNHIDIDLTTTNQQVTSLTY